jgi:hypothetical protein
MMSIRLALAHQGGWDELMYIGVPAVLAIVAIRWAGNRAARRHAKEHENEAGNDEQNDRS